MALSIETEIAAALGSGAIERHLDKFAREVAEYAKSIAPVFGDRAPRRSAPADGEPGDYRDSIHVENRGVGKRRVIADDFKAIWIEVGTTHMPEYAVFEKTAQHFGGSGVVFSEGIEHARHHLREALRDLAELRLAGAGDSAIAAAQERVRQGRIRRSAEFKAARGPRRRRRR